MKTNTIYLITNGINGKPYIGRTWQLLRKRFDRHKSDKRPGCIKLKRAFAKYGKDAFTVAALATCGNQATADYLERFWITVYDSIQSGYNAKEAGAHGRHTAEAIAKIIAANRSRATVADDTIVTEYLTGVSTTVMMDRHNTSLNQIYKILRRNGVKANRGKAAIDPCTGRFRNSIGIAS